MSKQFLKRVFNLFMEKGLKDGYFKNWSGIKNCVILNFSASLPGKLRSVVTSHVLSGSAWVLYVFKLHPLPKYSMLTLNEKIKKQNINKQSHRYLGNFLTNLSHSLSCLLFGTIILFL